MLPQWTPAVNLAKERTKIENGRGKRYWEVCNARVVVVIAIMKRGSEKMERGKSSGPPNVSWKWVPAVSLLEIKVAFSTHSFDSQPFTNGQSQSR